MKDEIQKVTLGTNEALRVTAEGEFIWHPEADAMIEEGDFTSSPAMRHILRALRKALAAPVQKGAIGAEYQKSPWDEKGISMPPPAAPDLQAELDATNRQVEILSDALAESRREVAALKAVQEPVAWVCYGAPGKRDIDFEEADINKLPIGTQLYTTPPAQPAVPDAITDNSESPEYKSGWNDCRAEMLKGMKP